jgi:small subunit ribosomal protein S2
VALIDTDCDPDDVDLPIPGNDDGIRSIEVVLQQLANAVLQGSSAVAAKTEGDGSPSEGQVASQSEGQDDQYVSSTVETQ